MKIALLGAGEEFLAAATSLCDAGHIITHYGPIDKHDRSIQDFFSKNTDAIPVSCHEEIDRLNVPNTLMVSYGRLIPKSQLKRQRFFNIHFAMLPRYRGFHGLVWAIINDEPQVGYSLHLVDDRVDAGPIYSQSSVEVSDQDDIISLRSSIIIKLRNELGETFHLIDEGRQPSIQNDSTAIVVTKRYPHDGHIDWKWSARLIFNHIRALRPPALPGAYTFWKDKKIIITKATYLTNPSYFSFEGKILDFINGSMWVKCGDTVIQIDEILVAGKHLVPQSFFKTVGICLGKGLIEGEKLQ